MSRRPHPSAFDGSPLDRMVRLAMSHYQEAVDDLRENNRKTKHWAWYVFPTSKAGRSQPRSDGVAMRVSGRSEQLEYIERLRQLGGLRDWASILKMVGHMGGSGNGVVMSQIDMYRLAYFYVEWKDVLRETRTLRQEQLWAIERMVEPLLNEL